MVDTKAHIIAPLEEDISRLPTSPGVYLLKDSHDNVVYVGKAKNLRQRLRSYVNPVHGDQRLAIPFLRRRAESIDYIVTENEKEALLLENTLIKKYQPRYNVRLRDDKTYLSLRLDTTKRYPRLEIIRRRKPGGGRMYFGPFSSAAALRSTLRFVQKIFPLRMCKDSQFKNRTRPCLMYSVGKCLAPCTKPVSEEEYRQLVEGVKLFFKGKREDVIAYLENLMHGYADRMEFEKAALIRDKISAIIKTTEQQKVSIHRAFDLDALGFARNYNRVVVSVLHYRKGLLEENRVFEFTAYEESEAEVLHAFLAQFYGPEKYVPPRVLVPFEVNDQHMLEEWLSDMRGSRARIKVPQRGEKKQILTLAVNNAHERLQAERDKDADREELLEKLRKKLNMEHVPRRIECFDISNIMGTLSVGSMVSFYNGEPDKNNYRRYKIRTVHAPNDYAMMREVLVRRYRRVLDESKELPDLILIDGGKGHLNVAGEVMSELGIRGVVLASIAKGPDPLGGVTGSGEDVRERDHIYLPRRKNPVKISPGSAVMLLLQRIRDEAHRFAITYHKKLRSAQQLSSRLDAVPGVGKVRRTKLLNHFGSMKRLRAAPLEEIAAVPGMPRNVAESIYHYLNSEPGNDEQK